MDCDQAGGALDRRHDIGRSDGQHPADRHADPGNVPHLRAEAHRRGRGAARPRRMDDEHPQRILDSPDLEHPELPMTLRIDLAWLLGTLLLSARVAAATMLTPMFGP